MFWLLKKILILPVLFYQKAISPFTPPSCRYHPTCSQYMVESIEEWGPFKGLWMGAKRFFRCHPWSEGGEDPVPRKLKSKLK
ncbi:MAG TPA: membrane protein insertion efficiency factor YidD [Bacteroidetes bacterium]|nr:membrane protein insertion efficiency factor YidD [Bacteroidota bacterium]